MSTTAPSKPGDALPEFRVPDSTGRERTLAEMTSARALALLVFRSPADARCVRQLRDYAEHLRDFNAELVNLAAVSVMSTEQGDRLRHRLDVRFPLLCDASAELCRAWGLLEPDGAAPVPRPALVVIDRDGKLVQLSTGSVDERAGAADAVKALRAGQPSAATKRVRVRFADRLAAWRAGRG